MKTRTQIFNFLKSKGIGRSFVNNCIKALKNEECCSRPVASLFYPERIDIIMDSFIGAQTKEGYDFGSKHYHEFLLWKQDKEN